MGGRTVKIVGAIEAVRLAMKDDEIFQHIQRDRRF